MNTENRKNLFKKRHKRVMSADEYVEFAIMFLEFSRFRPRFRRKIKDKIMKL